MRRRDCRDCGEPIVFLKAGPDRFIPVDADSVSEGDDVYEPRSGHINHGESCVAVEVRRHDARGG